MIASFADPEAERIFQRQHSRRLPTEIQRRAHRKLLMLHAATNLMDLRNPRSNHLESLKGDRAGQYSIRINDQWRICFRWESSSAYDVEIIDYH